MAIKKIPYANHDEWLEIRKNYIGGSDAGAIIGLNPYSSPYAVWAEKVGFVPGFEGNTKTKVGSYLEEFVAQMFEDESGKKVRRCNFTLVNDDYPWACANIDREIVGEDALLEIKTTNSFVNTKKFKQGEYPDQWMAQMTHYLAVTGKKKAYLAVLSECKDFRIFELDRDESEINALMEAESKFWNTYVVPIKAPPVDGSYSTTEAVKQIFQTADDYTADLNGMDHLLAQRKTFTDLKKHTEENIAEIDNQLKVLMGSASKAVCGNYSISWKIQNTAGLDRDAIRRDYPAFDFSKYASQARVFRVTEKRSKS